LSNASWWNTLTDANFNKSLIKEREHSQNKKKMKQQQQPK
jgi:hypothetical protein